MYRRYMGIFRIVDCLKFLYRSVTRLYGWKRFYLKGPACTLEGYVTKSGREVNKQGATRTGCTFF